MSVNQLTIAASPYSPTLESDGWHHSKTFNLNLKVRARLIPRMSSIDGRKGVPEPVEASDLYHGSATNGSGW